VSPDAGHVKAHPTYSLCICMQRSVCHSECVCLRDGVCGMCYYGDMHPSQKPAGCCGREEPAQYSLRAAFTERSDVQRGLNTLKGGTLLTLSRLEQCSKCSRSEAADDGPLHNNCNTQNISSSQKCLERGDGATCSLLKLI
jgi:hypothetical protein